MCMYVHVNTCTVYMYICVCRMYMCIFMDESMFGYVLVL